MPDANQDPFGQDRPRRVLGVFAKWPRRTTVKTRLGGTPEWGAQVARAFLLDTLSRLAGVPARRVLVFAPPSSAADFAALAGADWSLVPQAEGDLGRRLERFISEQLAAGVEQVVVVGTDSPTLPVAYVEEAFGLLHRADVVLGPATDGGYYLLGCGPRLPPLFDGIDWSTDRVLAQTVERLGEHSWRLTLLPPWYDVDTPESWAMLQGHVAALCRAGQDPQVPHTLALIEEKSS
jgi:rSAM/selenodomain-associated transferase 1